ncbi:MAG: ankyrin repeat domain-containing protein [Epsilonproteobacteria bacterium]|nr:ankyrin repeat domain-containing protein [Campylobacterota bacterium]
MIIKRILFLSLISTVSNYALTIEKPAPKSEVPIVQAIQSGDVKTFDTLLKNNNVNTTYEQNYTLMHYAVRNNQYDMVKQLILKGTALNSVAGEYQETPLHIAIRYGYLEIAVLLIKYHASPNIKDINGETPFELSKRLDYTNITQMLQSTYPALAPKEQEAEDKEVNKYKDGTVVNAYMYNDSVNPYKPSLTAEKVNLRHNRFESENEEKNNKNTLGQSHSDINIGN